MGSKLSIHADGVRLCSSCKLWKSLDLFTRHKHGKDGIGSRCKECDKEKARINRKNNRDKINQQRRNNYDPVKNYKQIKIWRSNNREKVNEAERKRYAKNPYKAKEKDYKRRAKLKTLGSISAKDWRNVCDKFGNKCLCCGKTNIKLTIDHVVPLKLGGTNSLDNLQPLCFSCNSSKGAKYIDYRGESL